MHIRYVVPCLSHLSLMMSCSAFTPPRFFCSLFGTTWVEGWKETYGSSPPKSFRAQTPCQGGHFTSGVNFSPPCRGLQTKRGCRHTITTRSPFSLPFPLSSPTLSRVGLACPSHPSVRSSVLPTIRSPFPLWIPLPVPCLSLCLSISEFRSCHPPFFLFFLAFLLFVSSAS